MNFASRLSLLVAPMAAILVLAARAPQADPRVPPSALPPQRDQLISYAQGRAAWVEARAQRDPRKQLRDYRCAEAHLVDATDGPGAFPEVYLALGLLNYERGQEYRAERSFMEVASRTGGALKAEALTYLGVLHLRHREWTAARSAFAAGEAESLAITRSSVESIDEMEARRLVAESKARAEALRPVRKVGLALATFYLGSNPLNPLPDAQSYENTLNAIDDMLRTSDYEASFDGKTFALWRFRERTWNRTRTLPVPVFPAARADWSYAINQPPPTNAAVIAPKQFGAAARAYAAGWLEWLRDRAGGDRPSPLPPVKLPASAQLTEMQDRRNAAQGLVHRLSWLENAFDGQGTPGKPRPDFVAALRVVDDLVAYKDVPGVGNVIRQQRAYIYLEGLPNLDKAREAIHSEGMKDDPLIYAELEALAQKLGFAGRAADAKAEWKLILDGVPESDDPVVKKAQQDGRAESRVYAEWQWAVLNGNVVENNHPPSYWLESLTVCPARVGREYTRYYSALRHAESIVKTNGSAADLLKSAERIEGIVAGKEGDKGLEGRKRDLRFFFDFLAEMAHKLGRQAMYRDVLRPRGCYYQHTEAYTAVQAYNAIKVPPASADAKDKARLDLIRVLSQIGGECADVRAHIEGALAVLRSDPTYRYDPEGEIRAAGYNSFVDTWNFSLGASERAARGTGAIGWAAAALNWQQVLRMGMERRAELEAVRPIADRLDRAGTEYVTARIHQAYRLAASGPKKNALQIMDLAGRDLATFQGVLKPGTADALRAQLAEHRGKLSGAGTTELGRIGGGQIVFKEYTGKKLRGNRNDRTSVLPTPGMQQPNVQAWLNRLQRAIDQPAKYPADYRGVKLLVDWFNSGSAELIARKNEAGSHRDPKERVGTGWTAASLMAFLRANIMPKPGVVPVGLTQYGYRDRATREKPAGWNMGKVRFNSAGYFLKNGRLIIHAWCSNPMDVILISTPDSPEPPYTGPDRLEQVIVSRDPIFRDVPLVAPSAHWDWFAPLGPTFTTPGPGWMTYPICPPAVTLLVKNTIAPTLIVPPALQPHCSPSRITIGQISSIDRWYFPIRVEHGTAENSKR